MRPGPSKDIANKRLASARWFRLTLVSLGTLLLIVLPQMLSAHCHSRAATSRPVGFLFTVTTTDDHNDFVCDGTDCTFREAIQAANNVSTDDMIDLSVTGTINLMSALPDISDRVTISDNCET